MGEGGEGEGFLNSNFNAMGSSFLIRGSLVKMLERFQLFLSEHKFSPSGIISVEYTFFL